MRLYFLSSFTVDVFHFHFQCIPGDSVGSFSSPLSSPLYSSFPSHQAWGDVKVVEMLEAKNLNLKHEYLEIILCSFIVQKDLVPTRFIIIGKDPKEKRLFKLILTSLIAFYQKCSGGKDVFLEKIFRVTNAFHSLDRHSWQLQIFTSQWSEFNLQLYYIEETALAPEQGSSLYSWDQHW